MLSIEPEWTESPEFDSCPFCTHYVGVDLDKHEVAGRPTFTIGEYVLARSKEQPCVIAGNFLQQCWWTGEEYSYSTYDYTYLCKHLDGSFTVELKWRLLRINEPLVTSEYHQLREGVLREYEHRKRLGKNAFQL